MIFSSFYPLPKSTLFAGRWINVYLEFVIDFVVEFVACFTYYLFHMSAAYFHIGLCLYVNAMQNDLKLQLKEIHRNINDTKSSVGHEFEQRLASEIHFHTQIYE